MCLESLDGEPPSATSDFHFKKYGWRQCNEDNVPQNNLNAIKFYIPPLYFKQVPLQGCSSENEVFFLLTNQEKNSHEKNKNVHHAFGRCAFNDGKL